MDKNNIKHLFIILIFSFIFIACKTANDKNWLLIQNLRSETLTDVKIEYSNGDKINIGKLNPSSKYKVKLVKSADENSINLTYVDEKKIAHKVLIIPYLLLAENKNYAFKIK